MAIKITPVDELPEVVRARYRKDIRTYIEQFLALGVDIARVDFDMEDYPSASSCAATFYSACMTWGKGRVEVRVRNKQVYLVRADPVKRRV